MSQESDLDVDAHDPNSEPGADDAPVNINGVANVDDFDEAYAERRSAAIAAGRRKGGVAGAAMAGAMMALSEIYEGPKKDEIAAVSESPDEPTDLDKDGFEVTIGDVDIASHPPTSG